MKENVSEIFLCSISTEVVAPISETRSRCFLSIFECFVGEPLIYYVQMEQLGVCFKTIILTGKVPLVMLKAIKYIRKM